jgi:hypothetical protein
MPRSHPVLSLDEKTEKESITDYEWACQTIIAMGNIVTQNLQGMSFQGRPLRTSSTNQVSPDTDVTPDVQIEAPIPPGAARYRAVNEIKANLPSNQNFWAADIDQLRKYDDELSNWSRAFPNPHDILFTTNELRVRALNDYLQSKGITFRRKFAILHSTRMEQSNTFIIVRKDFGEISDTILEEKLSNGVGVNVIHIIQEISQMKFYDARPPVVYTMMIIWDHVLKSFTDFKSLRALRGRQAFPIGVTIDQIREKLLHFTPETNSTCVHREWVKEALDGFCDIGVASVLNENEGKYEIRFRPQTGRDWIFERIRKTREGSAPAPSETLDGFPQTR